MNKKDKHQNKNTKNVDKVNKNTKDTQNTKGDWNMEEVLDLKKYPDKIEENACEWDVIGNIFQKAIQKKGMSKEQIEDTIKQIKLEMREK